MMHRWMAGTLTRLRTHRALAIALVSSAALHVVATVGTPIWISGWQQPESLQFNAVLNPLATAELTTAPDLKSQAVAPGPARRSVTRSPATKKSEATFLAPENAIAVERPSAGDSGGADAAVGENGDKLATASITPPIPATLPAAVETLLATTEKPAPSEAPAPASEVAIVVELPGRVSISYKASTSIADGVAHYIWKRDGTKYEFGSTIQASGFFVNMFAGTIAQQSSGTVTSAGIEPAQFSIRRGDRPPETAEFLRATKEIRLSRNGEPRQLAMPANLQDTQSFLFQLAFEVVKLKSPENRLTIWVTNARGLNQYTFKKVGEMTLETSLGPVETVHLVRETSEVRDSYEVWLSPKHHYLPVKLKFFLDRFPAELIATNIASTP